MTHFEEKTRKIEKIMTDLSDYLIHTIYTEKFMDKLKHVSDGRLISAIAETEMAIPVLTRWCMHSKICLEYEIVMDIPNSRSMYDVAFVSKKDPSIFIPCNIKVSSFKYNDNLNCQNILDFITSGNIPDKSPQNKKYMYEHALSINQNQNFNEPIDYYFICINKDDMEKSFYTSLLTIKELYPNASNLVQCNWAKNYQIGRTSLFEVTEDDIKEDLKRGLAPREYRSYEDSIEYIFQNYKECYKMKELQNKQSVKILDEQYKASEHVKELIYDRN